MNKLILAALAASLTSPVSAQRSAVAEAASEPAIDMCRIEGSAGAYAVSGTWRATQYAAAGFDLTVSDTGGAPSVTAHAINTKGTGATNHRSAGAACAASAAPAARSGTGGAVAAIVVASCTVSGTPESPVVTFTVPLAALGTKTGHVTLLKRGGDAGSAARGAASGAPPAATVVAACDSAKMSGGTKTGYDLAVSKKV